MRVVVRPVHGAARNQRPRLRPPAVYQHARGVGNVGHPPVGLEYVRIERRFAGPAVAAQRYNLAEARRVLLVAGRPAREAQLLRHALGIAAYHGDVGDVLNDAVQLSRRVAVARAVARSGQRDEVPRLRRVDEHLRAQLYPLPAALDDGGAHRPVLHLRLEHARLHKERNFARLAHHVEKRPLNNPRLEGEGVRAPVAGVHGRLARLVIGRGAAQELAVDARARAAHVVHRRNAAARHLPSDPVGLLDDGDLHSEPRRLNRRRAAAAARAYHGDVELHHARLLRGRRERREDEREKCENYLLHQDSPKAV